MSRRGFRWSRSIAMITGGATMLVLALVLIVLAVLLLQRERALKSAADGLSRDLTSAQAALSVKGPATTEQQRLAAADAAVVDLRRQSADLDRQTSGPVWSIAKHVPGLSKPVDAARQLALIVGSVSTDVLPGYVATLHDVAGISLTGGADLKPLADRAASFDADLATLSSLRARVNAIPHTGVGSVDKARDKAAAGLASLTGYARTLAVVSHVAPDLLGSEGPRTLLFVLETPAEERGSGGLVGGSVVVTAQPGKIGIDAEASNHSQVSTQPAPVVALDPAYSAFYGTRFSSRDWRVSGLSPDFPHVGAVWARLGQVQIGKPVDAVAALTPETLGRVLAVTGPVTLPGGGILNAGSAAKFFEKDIYAEFPGIDQEGQRTALQLAALSSVITKMQAFQGDPLQLLTAIGHGVDAGEVRLYATDPTLEATLMTTPVAGALPSTPGPFYGVATINGDGSKLDAYLTRTLTYRRDPIPGDSAHQKVSVTVSLTNTAPSSGLSPYVTYQDGLDAADNATAASHPGQHKVLVDLYLATDATFSSLTVNGKQTAPVMSGTERGHLLVEAVPPLIDPGMSSTITLTGIEPTSNAVPGTFTQAIAASAQQ